MVGSGLIVGLPDAPGARQKFLGKLTEPLQRQFVPLTVVALAHGQGNLDSRGSKKRVADRLKCAHAMSACRTLQHPNMSAAHSTALLRCASGPHSSSYPVLV